MKIWLVDAVRRLKKDNDPMASIGRFRLRCNLCGKMFRATSHFLRFCKVCRSEDEAFRFSEWLRS